jgi:uncharacterized membrane-anchored protein YitT (DUF2179 family)
LNINLVLPYTKNIDLYFFNIHLVWIYTKNINLYFFAGSVPATQKINLYFFVRVRFPYTPKKNDRVEIAVFYPGYAEIYLEV